MDKELPCGYLDRLAQLLGYMSLGFEGLNFAVSHCSSIFVRNAQPGGSSKTRQPKSLNSKGLKRRLEL